MKEQDHFSPVRSKLINTEIDRSVLVDDEKSDFVSIPSAMPRVLVIYICILWVINIYTGVSMVYF